ncbi:MAG: cation-transporting ATPase [Clostridia bacterium]|jgi:cation-transporting P-type ATPase C|nr:cation-transporting ATPase [Clostridia bacterium]
MLVKEHGSMILRGKVIHSIKGRVRLHYEGMRFISEFANEIMKRLQKIHYIQSIEINPITQNILIKYTSDTVLVKEVTEAIDTIISQYAIYAYKNMREQQAKKENEQILETETPSRTILNRLIINGATLTLCNTLYKQQIMEGALIKTPLLRKFTTLPSIMSLALTAPLFNTAWRGLVKDKRPNADFLTVSSIIASLMLDNSTSALTIIALSDIAEFMTSYTIERTRNSIKNLLSVDDGYVWKLLENGEIQKCSITEIKPGEKIVIHTGEKISVDGIITSGEAVIDQSSITGEFMPVIRKEEEQVFAGAIIKSGTITVQAEKVGDDTVVSRIINMVENVAAQKAPIQHYADKFSNYLVPLNFMVAAAVYGVTKSPEQALKMLVIDYSCGIKLSTATAFSASINSAVKKGILIKGGAFIEQMSNTDTIIFDKTGTITEGKPKVVGTYICDEGYTEQEFMELACAAEETSSHPLADAVLNYGRKLGVKIPLHGDTITVISKGTHTTVGDQTIRVGNLAFMRENKVQMDYNPKKVVEGAITTYVAVDQKLIGLISAIDKPRDNVRRAINNLRYRGIDDIMLLTGDMNEQAKVIAEQIGVDSYKAELLPEQKAETVLKMQSGGTHVVMIGDGINDAPALAYANVGISLGSKSTDVAMETSDIVIGSDDPMMIPAVLGLSGKTMEIVGQNFSLVVAINTVGLVVGAASNLSVFWSAMLHNMSTIFVVANSCRLLFYRLGKGGEV